MYFEVGKDIIAKDFTSALLAWCRDNLCLRNPEYDKKERMGLWCGNIPREIQLYERDGSNIILPFGCVARLRKLFPECRFVSRISAIQPFFYDSNINLYGYQEKAVLAALEARNGVVVMPCGAGKTQTALELISRIGGKALWLTHTSDLLNQSLNRAKSVLGADNSSYGTITGGKVNIGSGITFATVQTMSKLDLAKYRDVWDVVIVDECHKAIGSPTKVMQFYKVLSALSCRYKFGLTATPKRADGLEQSMFALLGGIIAEVSREEVADTTCEVRVEFRETNYMPNYDVVLAGDGTLNYAVLVEDMTQNQERFDFVLNEIERLDGSVLVLGNRVDYLRRLSDAYSKESICLSALGQSKSAKEARKQALKRLNDGELSAVFATYALAREGLDVPNLRYVVFSTPEKDPTTVTQAAGRVGRKAEEKPFGTVIDFTDNFGLYKSWQKKRLSLYKKLGYDII